MTPRFPHSATLDVEGRALPAAEVLRLLQPFLTEERRARIGAVVAERTYSVVPVLEGVHDAGNLNAVLRSAEALGFGAAHVVNPEGTARDLVARLTEAPLRRGDAEEAGNRRPARRQSQGADKWVDLQLWDTPAAGVRALRDRGYAILATHLSADAIPIGAWDFSRPTALVLGAEAEGISEDMLAAADANVLIPISGFAQSFNVSVAAALGLYHAREDRLRRLGHHGDLTDDEQTALAARYALRSVRRAESIIARQLDGDAA